jgi:hypothetical protein
MIFRSFVLVCESDKDFFCCFQGRLCRLGGFPFAMDSSSISGEDRSEPSRMARKLLCCNGVRHAGVAGNAAHR